ncbi:17699_t:CDS:2 [Cetraspora pellucida]|uniref:17699_t:CDS:1 n=1 Tax=Cetraspora pellucida TaxID=1433469 RepID=A0A9N9E1P0_9GLOM|nr:17699_t:CDS:2 [Cetraspora pellucida]
MALIERSTLQEIKQVISTHLSDHYSFPASELVRENPPIWYCENKQIVYNMACPNGADSFHGTLEYTQWTQFDLPKSFDVERRDIIGGGRKGELEIEVLNDIFDYSPPDDDNTVIWYINFADFGPLFAQDEMQCLEHPALCSLRDKLYTIHDGSQAKTRMITSEKSIATPVLIRGVERRAFVKTDCNETEGRPSGLYGNHFARAEEKVIKLATTVFDKRLNIKGKPYYSNIIAIEAPKYGEGCYTNSTIRMIIETAYSGFLAARFESLVETGVLERRHKNEDHTVIPEKEDAVVPRIIIHTGNWGCGAHGGNISLMACLQFVAAHLAGIDKIVYHTIDDRSLNEVDLGLETFRELVMDVDGVVKVDDFISKLERKKFHWGFSNGT